jgi:IS30 family transposase
LTLETEQKLISYERIYRWVYEDGQQNGVLHKHLMRAYKLYHKCYGVYNRRGCIPERRMLDERPTVVEERHAWGIGRETPPMATVVMS